jgi:hypothetical protein
MYVLLPAAHNHELHRRTSVHTILAVVAGRTSRNATPVLRRYAGHGMGRQHFWICPRTQHSRWWRWARDLRAKHYMLLHRQCLKRHMYTAQAARQSHSKNAWQQGSATKRPLPPPRAARLHEHPPPAQHDYALRQRRPGEGATNPSLPAICDGSANQPTACCQLMLELRRLQPAPGSRIGSQQAGMQPTPGGSIHHTASQDSSHHPAGPRVRHAPSLSLTAPPSATRHLCSQPSRASTATRLVLLPTRVLLLCSRYVQRACGLGLRSVSSPPAHGGPGSAR